MPQFTDRLDLPVVCLEITAEAEEPLHLPTFPGSKFEGALGNALFALTCSRREYHAKHGCKGCVLQASCAHGVLYEPALPSHLPAGLSRPPRPFTLVTSVSQPRDLVRGEVFSFGLNVVGSALAFLPFLLNVLRALGAEGIGLTRGRFKTLRVQSVDPFGGDAVTLSSHASSVIKLDALRLSAASLPPLPDSSQLHLTFQSMVQLKSKGAALLNPSFADLVRALQRRLSNLEQIYGAGATVGLDYGELPALAARVEETHARWQQVSQARARNTSLSGVVGAMTLRGDLAPFTTLLRYGELVGVGKWASFGLGRYRVSA